MSALIAGCGTAAENGETAVSDPQPLININDDIVSASAERGGREMGKPLVHSRS
ncbi:MAG: hypothetical protein MZV63_06990 [Marinilabiliales bacterium]|nr:hypothetical protein [Marinilabiliales bacterium]